MAAKKTNVKNEPVATGDRQAALETVISRIERDCGKGSIMRLGEVSNLNVEAVSTGSLSLDLALGVGGIPKGRITEIYGPESSGKTTVALHVVAEVQKAGGEAAFIDAEHALDPVYAKALGVDIEELLVSQPDSGEQALDVTEHLVRSGAVDVVVVDSVAALVPQQEIDGTMGASHVGLQARLMSQALRKLSGVISKTNCVAIFINQLREKVGVMYGNPETTTGGRALKFYASIRLDIRRVATIKGADGVAAGSRVKVKVVKNKLAPPFMECEFDIMYAEGISRAGSLLDVAIDMGILEKRGSWFAMNDVQIAQGREQTKLAIQNDLELQKAIETEINARRETCEIAMPHDDAESEEDLVEDEEEAELANA